MILAIDPGNVRSGWVLYDDSAIIHGLEDNEVVLNRLLSGWFRRAGVVAIEMIAHYGTGMPAGKTVFDTCVWIGRFVQASRKPDEVLLVPRMEVKMHLCGSARAKDGNVRQAVIDRLGEPGTKKKPGFTHGVAGDVWQALALALTVADRRI